MSSHPRAPDTASDLGRKASPFLSRRIVAASLLLLGAAFQSGQASAQGFGPPQPGGGLGPGGTPRQDKPDAPAGPAEAAPEGEDETEAELPPLPAWPGEERKRVQLFEIHGYLRFRADLQHNHNLGMGDDGITRAPFWRPIAENDESTQACAERRTRPVVGTGNDREIESDDCPSRTLSGANLRLRVEPTINISEDVRIHSQIDILDNLVLGSTPDSLSGRGPVSDAPVPFLSESQAPPVVGENSATPAIVVKRAWGEVDTALGQIKFGRMPWHWGLGVVANDGNCWDCNFGDNQDRVSFATAPIAGHTFGIAYDFSGSGPHSLNVRDDDDRIYQFQGQAVDLEQLDDVDQLVLHVGRFDRPEVIADRLGRGDVVLNYGAFVVWRRQAFDYVSGRADDIQGETGTVLDQTAGRLAQRLVERHAHYWMPDLWFKLAWHKLLVEVEGVLVAGNIANASDTLEEISSRDILQGAFVMRSQYAMLDDQLTIGLEIGFASGDESELFDLNRRRNALLGQAGGEDTDLDEFRFDDDYLVDLILFREIMGTVANATYFKPWVQFEWMETLGARLDLIYSLAHQTVAYPGNARNLGLELDLDLYYQNIDQGFYAGLQYGVLFPFAALDRPQSIYGGGADDASIAQTLQARLILKY